ncbi:MAG: NADPH:quinone oxidoreductase family protein, partial [Acidobacteriota bacterium]|nr:NADPH:quinone oxidoreductase family protein [Acidobacteriota bacterium]
MDLRKAGGAVRMKAWLVREFGDPEQMDWAEVELPQPGPGEVRIRNRAAALNFFDMLQIQGNYQVKPPLPFTPGAEIAGTVDAVGDDVRGFMPGDRVLSLPQIGGFAEYTVANVSTVFPVPAGMDWAQAAAMPIVYHTAWFGLKDRGQLCAGEWLLVHAGASGAGMAAIQVGRALGARVIATAGSDEKVEFAREQGAHIAFDYRSGGWVEEVRKLTGGRGADVIFDPVGGDVFDLSTKCIAPGGRLLVIGFASGRIPSIAMNRVLLKN